MDNHSKIQRIASEIAELSTCEACPVFNECDNPMGKCYRKTLARARLFKACKHTAQGIQPNG